MSGMDAITDNVTCQNNYSSPADLLYNLPGITNNLNTPWTYKGKPVDRVQDDEFYDQYSPTIWPRSPYYDQKANASGPSESTIITGKLPLALQNQINKIRPASVSPSLSSGVASQVQAPQSTLTRKSVLLGGAAGAGIGFLIGHLLEKGLVVTLSATVGLAVVGGFIGSKF